VPDQACKPSSVPCICKVAIIYLGRQLPAASSDLPEGHGTSSPGHSLRYAAPCSILLPMGFA